MSLDKAHVFQMLDVVGQRGRRCSQCFLQLTDGCPCFARPNQQTVDPEACWITQGFQARRSLFETIHNDEDYAAIIGSRSSSRQR